MFLRCDLLFQLVDFVFDAGTFVLLGTRQVAFGIRESFRKPAQKTLG